MFLISAFHSCFIFLNFQAFLFLAQKQNICLQKLFLSSKYSCKELDCNTVRIFAYSSTREQSNKRSRTSLKTESETGERRLTRVRLARFARVRLLRHALPISLLILRKKPTVLQFFFSCLTRRVRLARFPRVRLLRHALLILRKKPTVLQSSKEHFVKRKQIKSTTVPYSKLRNMSRLYPVRTCFFLTCTRLDATDVL